MALPPVLRDRLRLPVIGAPLFIISNPDLVIAQCKAGIVGAFPSLNARPISQLDEWLHRITEELSLWDRDNPLSPSAPFAVNQIVHKTNNRLEEDVALCVKWKAPIVITSLGAREDVNAAVHAYGGITLHDIINDRFARKAIEKGAEVVIERTVLLCHEDDVLEHVNGLRNIECRSNRSSGAHGYIAG